MVPKVTVNAIAVAAVTVPTAPSSKVTVLFPAVVLKPKPLMMSVAALADKFAILRVTTEIGRASCRERVSLVV